MTRGQIWQKFPKLPRFMALFPSSSNALNYRVWGLPAVLSRGIPGNALRAFPEEIPESLPESPSRTGGMAYSSLSHTLGYVYTLCTLTPTKIGAWWAARLKVSILLENIRSKKLQNESSPNFSIFCPEFFPEFCPEFSPNCLRIFGASLHGQRRPKEIHQKSPPFFNAKFPGKHEKIFTKCFWRASTVRKLNFNPGRRS